VAVHAASAKTATVAATAHRAPPATASSEATTTRADGAGPPYCDNTIGNTGVTPHHNRLTLRQRTGCAGVAVAAVGPIRALARDPRVISDIMLDSAIRPRSSASRAGDAAGESGEWCYARAPSCSGAGRRHGR
jgi:hypothetical protein